MITKGKYILDEKGEPVEETDLMKWATWFENAGESRRVAYDQIGSDPQNFISTVFLGMDLSFEIEEHTPILFETMIFGCGDREQETYRYSTRSEAEEGHKKLVEELKALHIA